MTRTDYEVVTERGIVAFTTPQLELAKRWFLQNRMRFGPLHIEEVNRTETRRRVYRATAEPAEIEALARATRISIRSGR